MNKTLYRILRSTTALTASAGILFAFVHSADALENPRRSRDDHRIQYVDYSKDNVVRVNAANGFITTLVFAPGESVVNYGSGYSTAWEFATADNQFFLKPKAEEGTTNLVIVTTERIYSLDIYLVEKPANATYKLTFRYPLDYIAAKIKAGQESYVQQELSKPDPDLEPAGRFINYNYTMNFGETAGSRQISPTSCYDNGRFTYFKFRDHADFPAVYRVSDDGEAIVNSHVENGVLVVHGVYPEFRLRAGSDVVGIYNESFGKDLAAEGGDNTTVKGLAREFKEQQ